MGEPNLIPSWYAVVAWKGKGYSKPNKYNSKVQRRLMSLDAEFRDNLLNSDNVRWAIVMRNRSTARATLTKLHNLGFEGTIKEVRFTWRNDPSLYMEGQDDE